MSRGQRPQQRGPGGSHPRAVAIDYDGTLTDTGMPEVAVREALGLLRSAGIATVLVTGRILTELEGVFPDVAAHFDAIVAENGVVVAGSAGFRRLGPAMPPALADALAARGVLFRRGLGILACRAADEHAVLDEVRRLGLEVQLVHNRGELMVLPTGVNKGTGLREVLGVLGLSAHDTLAVGDAENDHSLLAAAEVGVAVANAVASLKEEADVVLPGPDGAGVAELLRDVVAGWSSWVRITHRFLTLGTDDGGESFRLPARPANLLIAGAPGDGKSYLAGLLAEQLIDLGYGLLVVDPEGDHTGLGRLDRVVVVGGDLAPPPAATVAALLRARDASVVVDLSSLRGADRDRYLLDLAAQVEAVRRETGRPHWVFLDEADSAVGRHEASPGPFLPAADGYCFVTWHPENLPVDHLAAVDTVLAMTSPHPTDTLVDLTAAVARRPAPVIGAQLAGPSGRVLVARRGAVGALPVVQLAPRTTGHFRHEHKYASVGVGVERRFWFRTEPDRLTGATAANLGELETELAHCDRGVLRHHAPRHDLSRWIADVFHDQDLADRIGSAEREIKPDSAAIAVESGRLALLAALHARRSQRLPDPVRRDPSPGDLPRWRSH